ncbi:hypothetical protein ABC641_08615 [Lacticaseibacillus paracasei]
MFIQQKRIFKAGKMLMDVKRNSDFFLGSVVDDQHSKIIKDREDQNLDFDVEWFPAPLYGIMSRRNADGEYIVDRTKPKVTDDRFFYYSLPNWHGVGNHSGSCYIEFERFQRNFIPPKEFKIRIVRGNDGEKLALIDRSFVNNPQNYEDILYATNLLLELFGSAEARSSFREPPSFKRVNWEILPRGQKIWNAVKSGCVRTLSRSDQILIEERYGYLQKHNPTNVYCGIGGYTGYFVFEFQKSSDVVYYVFDSILYGKATYVFEGDWKEMSRLTKKQILSNSLQTARIIHNEGWTENVEKYV